MPTLNGEQVPRSSPEDQAQSSRPPFWKISAFLGFLGVDLIQSVILLSPLLGSVTLWEGWTVGYTFYGSLFDLAILAVARLLLAVFGMTISFFRADVVPEFPFDLYHPNGDKKSREELEQELLEEPVCDFLGRYVRRTAFAAEVLALTTQIVCVAKCLVRMNVEIGTRSDAEPCHPLFWIAVLLTTLFSIVEAFLLDSVCKLAGEYGRERMSSTLLQRISSSLSVPLLAEDPAVDEDEEQEQAPPESSSEEARGITDITSDPNYKASWTDLLSLCYPDLHMIAVAFIFLLLAAIAQVYIPRFLGNILDALAEAFSDADDDAARHQSMFDVPGFISNVKLLVIASVLAGVFAGIRGSIFTVVGGRVNVRLRVQLMDALLSQDIGFFDVTKTGDITSRLSSDTTLVGDQVSLNVNVFLRSLVQAAGVLLFMFLVSWQLSILAFISVPLITLFSKWYGEYVRSLTKLMQKKLADGNAVSEAALGAMPTVRSFDAAESELHEFEQCMQKYLDLNMRSAVAYCGFAAFTTSLPQLVFAVVVFYGGLLVRNGDMTSGQLVSFLLYLSSLSDAFASVGWVFSSLTQAVGAADKVFELMHRKPRITPPSRSDPPPACEQANSRGILGISATKTRQQRTYGVWPRSVNGDIEFVNVDLFYPARPQRQVLNGLSLRIKSGSVVALVGESGGGKTSIVSLIEHLYDASAGKVLLDGTDVQNVAPAWLSKHVAVVSQQPILFGRSIRRNIMYGMEGTDAEPSQEDIESAAKLANAHEFIQRMPQKYDTEVGEKGVQLSGGQRQRIAIARALVRKPRVLLLDEATSALDAESEHYVQMAIDDMLGQGRGGGLGSMTVVIIAHRLSTVRSADCIYVIKAGQVVEKGKHEDLVANTDGVYANLISRQLEAQRTLDKAEDSSGSSEHAPISAVDANHPSSLCNSN